MANSNRTTDKHIAAAAVAHGNLSVYGAIVAILEGSVISGGRYAAGNKIIRICETEMQRQLAIYDRERAKAAKEQQA